MLEDVIEILLEKNGGRWEGTLTQLLDLVEVASKGWDQQRLGYELKQLKCCRVTKVILRTPEGRARGVVLDRGLVTQNPDPFDQNPDPVEGGSGFEEISNPDPGCRELGKKPNKRQSLSEAYEQRASYHEDLLPALKMLHPNTPFEVRCIEPKAKGYPKTAAGVFDNPEAAAQAANAYNGKYKGLYFTLNPTSMPVTNKLAKAEQTTTDAQITTRRWLLIDIEGARPNAKDTNATDQEVLAAIHLAEEIRQAVTDAQPLVLCSGNGCHLLYRIELPNTPEVRTMVKQALYGLAARYNNNRATVDVTVSNASRISKLPGTLTRKGEHTDDRPQRYAFVLDWAVEGVLPEGQLQEWASWAPPDHKPKAFEVKTTVHRIEHEDREERARKWLEKREPAIEGQGGDDWTYQTASAVFVDFDLSEAQALTVLREWNRRCQPPWDESELAAFVAKADKYATGTRGQKLNVRPSGWTESTNQDERLNGFAWTDLGNARAMLYLYGERLRWCTTSQKWLYWLGTHWQMDDKNRALAWANKTMLARLSAAELIEDEEQRKKAKTYFRSCQQTSRRNSCLEQVKAWVPNNVVTDELDRQNWLLNCRNGTLDLKACRLQRHQQDDYITRCIDAEFDPMAQCPQWLTFLDKVMGGDQDMIGYLQRAVGYSLTGDTREQCLFLCHGGGKNGKSVFLEVLGKLLAGYSCQSPATTFSDKDKESIPNDVARLKGARLVRCVETDEKLSFNEGLVKQMTGSDVLTARFLRAEFFEFRPTFKLWFATNHKPAIKGSDNGIWRRMRLIPWNVVIADDEEDKDLEGKLLGEAAGILAWAIRGCQDWQRGGLMEPAIVRQETDDYRQEQDIIGQWIAEQCDTGPFLRESTSLLYKYFCQWAKEKRIWEGNELIFGRRLTSKGFGVSKGGLGKRMREGLRINLVSRKEEDSELPAELAAQKVLEGFSL